jgi:hypothetical protein
MVSAALAILASAQMPPLERARFFLEGLGDFSVNVTSTTGPDRQKVELTYQSPNFQLLKSQSAGPKSEFRQTPDGIIAINHMGKAYWEYATHPRPVVPPPEFGEASAAYPGFLYFLYRKESIKGSKVLDRQLVRGIEADWVEIVIDGGLAEIQVKLAVAMTGQILQAKIPDELTGDVIFDFESFGAVVEDVRRWKYQPPIGYMPGNSPQIYRPAPAGSRLTLGTLKSSLGQTVNLKAMGSNGVAILVTSADCEPSKLLLKSAKEMASAAEKAKTKFVEITLDGSLRGDRPWPVVTSGVTDLIELLDPPVTPYIYFVNKEGYVIGGWAGFAADQKSPLLKRIVDVYAPPEKD